MTLVWPCSKTSTSCQRCKIHGRYTGIIICQYLHGEFFYMDKVHSKLFMWNHKKNMQHTVLPWFSLSPSFHDSLHVHMTHIIQAETHPLCLTLIPALAKIWQKYFPIFWDCVVQQSSYACVKATTVQWRLLFKMFLDNKQFNRYRKWFFFLPWQFPVIILISNWISNACVVEEGVFMDWTSYLSQTFRPVS